MVRLVDQRNRTRRAWTRRADGFIFASELGMGPVRPRPEVRAEDVMRRLLDEAPRMMAVLAR
jgi:hypothetical protein